MSIYPDGHKMAIMYWLTLIRELLFSHRIDVGVCWRNMSSADSRHEIKEKCRLAWQLYCFFVIFSPHKHFYLVKNIGNKIELCQMMTNDLLASNFTTLFSDISMRSELLQYPLDVCFKYYGMGTALFLRPTVAYIHVFFTVVDGCLSGLSHWKDLPNLKFKIIK